MNEECSGDSGQEESASQTLFLTTLISISQWEPAVLSPTLVIIHIAAGDKLIHTRMRSDNEGLTSCAWAYLHCIV